MPHSSHSSPPAPPLLYIEPVCVREQREGQNLPRLLAGVMHKTDPVVFMQRKTERERGREGDREGERGGNKWVN